jgi:hypothetical protein
LTCLFALRLRYLWTPDELDFCPPICPVRCTYFLWKERERLKAFATIRDKKKTWGLASLTVFFSLPWR